MATEAAVWVLLGRRHGDNQQLLAIAAALGLPHRAVRLRFNPLSSLPPWLLRASHASWRADADADADANALAPPWPRLVLAAGRRTVPAALWIRRRSGGRARLVQLNRPRAPLGWFDLVVTTPQYALPPRANVLARLLPFVEPPAHEPLPPGLAARAATLPRPWTAVVVGGASRPYVLDDAAAARLANVVNERLAAGRGSAWIVGSPRTPASALAVLQRGVHGPAVVLPFGGAEQPYAALRGLADDFIVTADSASMLAEALVSGRPVAPFALPAVPDLRFRIAAALRRWPLLTRWFASGLVSLRDVGLLQRALADAGAFDGRVDIAALAAAERAATLARIRALLDRG